MDLYNALGAGIWRACGVLGREPKSAIDFGSSIGALLSVLPVDRRRGLEYSPDAVANRMVDDIVLTDLDDAGQIGTALDGATYDLIICQEVAEHLKSIRSEESPTFSMPITEGIRRASHDNSVLAFGAGYPNQPGRGHISCRTARFWQYALEYSGWEYQHRATMVYVAIMMQTQDIFARNGHTNCYMNTMIFTRKER
jgi:hypothetical protein